MNDDTGPGSRLTHYLLARCDAYCANTGTSLTTLSLALTRNPSGLTRIRNGGNTEIKTIDAMMAKLDELELTNERLIYGAQIKKPDTGSTKAAEHRRKGAAVS